MPIGRTIFEDIIVAYSACMDSVCTFSYINRSTDTLATIDSDQLASNYLTQSKLKYLHSFYKPESSVR